MSTEVWFRNPHNYIKEIAEVGEPYRIVWDRGILIKKHITPEKHAALYLGENSDWRVLCVGDQGTAEVKPGYSLEKPAAVYPTWSYGDDIEILEEILSLPVGNDMEMCTADVPADQRPVFGQEHRIVITNLPDARKTTSRSFFRTLKELQEDYPEAIIHLHNMYSFRIMFGMGFGSADMEPRGLAANGRVYIPAGKQVTYEQSGKCPQWIHLLGMQVSDLKIPRNRCIYNIRSARWAGENFTKNIRFKTQGSVTDVDTESSTTPVPTTSATRTRNLLRPKPGDKITCDDCSLSLSCKYFRVGAVCSVPGSESSILAKYFGSRDSGQIIDALGTLLGAQANRLERGMLDEEEFGELDPEVTKIMNQLFSNGVKLAKLVDPSLNKPLVQINQNGKVGNANPKQFMASVIKSIEAQGIRREDITPEMVESMVKQMGETMEQSKPEPLVIESHIEK